MQVNKKKFVEEIWKGVFGSNSKKCAMALRINPDQLCRFVFSEKTQAGLMFLGGLVKYCNERGLDFRDYILP